MARFQRESDSKVLLRHFLKHGGACGKTRPADACEWNHRQRRLLSSEGITERLVTAILIPHTGEALNRHQKFDHCARQSDEKDCQLQDQECKLHRQITSFRKRKRYWNQLKASEEYLRFVAEAPGVKGAPQNRCTCNVKGLL